MKLYIRYFDKKSFWNFLLKGRVFFLQKKFGFYAMKDSPTVYLKEFSKQVKELYIIKPEHSDPILLKGEDYYEANECDIIQVNYIDGSVKMVGIAFNPFTGSYCYMQI